jgi:uncharacterized damage-inducible protein DinB
MDLPEHYLTNIKEEFLRYKGVAEKCFEQLTEEDLHFVPNEGDNSIAVIVKHMAGNMRSRWTNFLTEDGEKTWRHRETEFEPTLRAKAEVLEAWNSGWACLLEALESLAPEQVLNEVKIREEAHTVIEAINRQLAHYAYHTGQIVYLAKSIRGAQWKSPSIPKGQSDLFNKKMAEKASGDQKRA